MASPYYEIAHPEAAVFKIEAHYSLCDYSGGQTLVARLHQRLMPMILETSMQARFLIPMAISLGFGVMFATVITLVFVPAFYLALEDLRSGTGRALAWFRGDAPGGQADLELPSNP